MTTIHHEVVLPATPARVYAVLTDDKQFAAATGDRPAEIGAGEGAAFSLFGGAIHGRHVELVPGERIVQAWRVKMWPPGMYSIVQFTLTSEAAGTRLAIDHAAYPAEQHEHLSGGWVVNYIETLSRYLS